MKSSSFVQVEFNEQPVSIEYLWLNCESKKENNDPVMIFLHEGLGSVAMWKDFPETLCKSLNVKGLVYSRRGYGESSARNPGEMLKPDFMHQEAFYFLPELLKVLKINSPPWLFGHSDGGSVALLYASRFNVAGLIVLAPHTFVEEVTLCSIEKAGEAYVNTNLRARLSRYHADVDSAFWGWNQIWLNPEFRHWSIEEDIRTVTCPILAIQGVDDEYGSMLQIMNIAKNTPQTQLLELSGCGHSPHRDQPEALIQACLEFFVTHLGY
jgi:pimeloyl-ACP methyl ester carboxylesterase